MRLFRKLVIIYLSFFIYTSAGSQVVVTYNYDASGNRIERLIELNVSKAAENLADSTKIEDQKPFEDKFDKVEVTIYPNPTKGQLIVNIKGYENESPTAIYIYNTNGALLLSKTPIDNSNTLDLSNYANAMYILKVVVGRNVSEWKIIKK